MWKPAKRLKKRFPHPVYPSPSLSVHLSIRPLSIKKIQVIAFLGGFFCGFADLSLWSDYGRLRLTQFGLSIVNIIVVLVVSLQRGQVADFVKDSIYSSTH